MPPAGRLQPGAGERPCPSRFGLREGRCVASDPGGIIAEILQLRHGQPGADHPFAEVLPVDYDCRHGSSVGAARPEADRRCLGSQRGGGEILCGLPTRPASRSALAELSPLKRIDAQQAKVHGDRVAIESARLGIEGLRGGGRGSGERQCRRAGKGQAALQDTISTSTRSPQAGKVQTRKGCIGLVVRTMLMRPGRSSKSREATRFAFSRLQRSSRLGERPGLKEGIADPLRGEHDTG